MKQVTLRNVFWAETLRNTCKRNYKKAKSRAASSLIEIEDNARPHRKTF